MRIGVDPGINGALAAYDGVKLSLFDFPVTKSKGAGNMINWHLLCVWLDHLFEGSSDNHALIENVHSFPGNAANSTFKFGVATGGVIALLVQHGCSITFTSPTEWKKAMRLTPDKDYSRTRAMELFPEYAERFSKKRDHNLAEASLILYYGLNMLPGFSMNDV